MPGKDGRALVNPGVRIINMNEQAELLITQIWFRTIEKFSDIFSFRSYTLNALPYIKNQVDNDTIKFVRSLAHDMEHEKFFINKEEFFKIVGGIDGLASMSSQKQIETYRKVIDSSSIILAHSAIDAAVFDYFRVIELVAPIQDFEQYLLKKQIALEDLKGLNYQEIFKQKIHKFIAELERRSLLEKIDKLFQICKPLPQFSPINDYLYNREKLEALDELRHEIVHGNGLKSILPSCDEDIIYMRNTANFLMALVIKKYDVKINLTVWRESIQKNGKI